VLFHGSRDISDLGLILDFKYQKVGEGQLRVSNPDLSPVNTIKTYYKNQTGQMLSLVQGSTHVLFRAGKY